MMGELSILLCQTSSHLHLQPFYIQAAAPTTAKNAGAKQPTHQALTQPPALVTEAGLLVATVFPVAVLLPSVVLTPPVAVALPVVLCRSKYPPASGCPNPVAVKKSVKLNGYRFVTFDALSGK